MVAKSRSRSLALLTTLTLLIATAIAAPPARAQEFLDVWTKAGMQTLITGPVKANLAYTDQSGKEQVISIDQLTAAQLDGMPKGLAEVGKSQLLRTGFFDQLWSSIKDQVCHDVQANIQRLVNRSPNSAYDIQPCVMNPKSYVIATFNTNWSFSQLVLKVAITYDLGFMTQGWMS